MSAKIPQVQSEDRKFNQYQQNVGKALQLVLNNPLNYGVQLKDVALSSGGANTVPHTLNRKLQGWFIVRQRVAATSPVAVGIQDGQAHNTRPDQTLILYVTSNVLVDIWVY